MSKKTTGEVELKVLELPKEIKQEIEQVFKLKSRSAGRPNLLQLLSKAGYAPEKVALELVYLKYVENRSFDDLVSYISRKYKQEVAKSTVFNFFKQLEQAGLQTKILEYAQAKVKRKVKIWYIDDKGELRSDVDYIQSYIDRNKHTKKRRVLEQHLKNLEEIVNTIGKLPHEWSEEDISAFLNRKYEYYLQVIRQKVAQNAKGFYAKLSEKEQDDRARENVRKYLTTIRVFLDWIGRRDLSERFSHTEWKREYTITDWISVEEFNKIMSSPLLSDLEKFILKLHVTVGCREGRYGKYGLNGLQWSKIDWERKTIDVYESKTKGGTVWKGVYLELFFPNFMEELRYWHERRVNDSDYILESLIGSNGKVFDFLQKTVRKVEHIIGRHYRLHFNRKTHAVWLIEADVPLELIAGKPSQAFFGVGWEDLNTLMKHYGAFAKEKLERELQKVRTILTPKLLT